MATYSISPTARRLSDKVGLPRGILAMVGPREVLLSSEEPAVCRFLTGRRQAPIGVAAHKAPQRAHGNAREGRHGRRRPRPASGGVGETPSGAGGAGGGWRGRFRLWLKPRDRHRRPL